jgi:pilus assembly protein FimV
MSAFVVPRLKFLAAGLLCVALHTQPAHAQALGQARVLSALGEPLVAEIELLQVTPQQLGALRARMATPSEFATAGMTYNQVLQGLAFSLQRYADGRTFLRLSGKHPVNDLFVELIVQAQGSGAPVWRDYTLLLEPRAGRAGGADASPVALGQARVLSGLGEPLRAEVDLPQFPSGDGSGLRAAVAPPAEYQAAGMTYSPELRDLQLAFRRRPDGSAFLSITSTRHMTQPSMDLLLEATTSAGRVVRDYTLPLSPRVSAAPVAAPVAAPAAPVAAAPGRSAAGPVGPGPDAAASAPAPAAAATATAAASAAQSPAIAAGPAPGGAPAPKPADRKVQVKAGDTASRIAMANKPAEISLDQMLVAMLRANPDAFIDGNVNRLKAGATLTVPAPEQAAAISKDESTAVLQLQSRNFEEFRRKLAENAAQRATPGSRQSSGKIEANLVEKKPAAPSPNRLSLSDGAVGSLAADIAARARRAEESTAKLATELRALSAASAASATRAASAASATRAASAR